MRDIVINILRELKSTQSWYVKDAKLLKILMRKIHFIVRIVIVALKDMIIIASGRVSVLLRIMDILSLRLCS